MRKKYSELTFTDDFMFWKILVNNPDLCKELLELILGVKIKKICPPEGQKTMEHKYEGRGIRLDVYVEDAENTIYDLEMQTTLRKDLPKRMRYYQGMIDSNLISRNEPYSKLKKSNIIFLCTDDPFGKRLPIYTFVNVCIQDNSLKLGDDTVKIVINPNSERNGLSENMNGFLDLLQGKKVGYGIAEKISDAVDKAKRYEEWEAEYMTLDMKLMEEREAGREEGLSEGIEKGLAQGRAQGIAQGRAEIIKSMIDNGKTPDEIAEFCGCPIDDIVETQNTKL